MKQIFNFQFQFQFSIKNYKKKMKINKKISTYFFLNFYLYKVTFKIVK
jgi:hypothetical protein